MKAIWDELYRMYVSYITENKFLNQNTLPGVLGVCVPNDVLELSRGLGMVGIKSVLRRLAR